MNFEQFRTELETQLLKTSQFELQEFHYQPQSFGNGIVAYRIFGRIFKIEYDGREQEILLKQSEPHQKYFGASFTEIGKFYELEDSLNAVLECLQPKK